MGLHHWTISSPRGQTFHFPVSPSHHIAWCLAHRWKVSKETYTQVELQVRIHLTSSSASSEDSPAEECPCPMCMAVSLLVANIRLCFLDLCTSRSPAQDSSASAVLILGLVILKMGPPVHWKTFSSILGLYPVDVKAPLFPPSCDEQNCHQRLPNLPPQENPSPHFRATGLTLCQSHRH